MVEHARSKFFFATIIYERDWLRVSQVYKVPMPLSQNPRLAYTCDSFLTNQKKKQQ